ncbi:cyclin family protein, partial [Striga asiatica]
FIYNSYYHLQFKLAKQLYYTNFKFKLPKQVFHIIGSYNSRCDGHQFFSSHYAFICVRTVLLVQFFGKLVMSIGFPKLGLPSDGEFPGGSPSVEPKGGRSHG